MKHSILPPDYNHSIVSLSNSLLHYYHIPSPHKGVEELNKLLSDTHPRNIVYMTLSGMGQALLEYHLDESSFLRRHFFQSISSVFPSSPPTTTVSLQTGLTPSEHGQMPGINSVQESDHGIDTACRKEASLSERNAGNSIGNNLKYQTIYEQISKNHTGIKTVLLSSHDQKEGSNSFQSVCNQVIQITEESGDHLIGVYWTDLAVTACRHGCFSEETHKLIVQINHLLEETLQKSHEALFLITADYGLTDICENIILDQFPSLINLFSNPPSHGGRSVSFWIKKGYEALFEAEFNKILGDEFLLFPKNKFLKSGLLGPGIMHADMPDFIGDFMAITSGPNQLIYPTKKQQGYEKQMASYGGLSQSEIKVPLIIILPNQ